MRRLFVSLLAAMAVATVAATAETAGPQAFVDSIYKHYLGRDSKGLALSNEVVIRRYFAPPLARRDREGFRPGA